METMIKNRKWHRFSAALCALVLFASPAALLAKDTIYVQTTGSYQAAEGSAGFFRYLAYEAAGLSDAQKEDARLAYRIVTGQPSKGLKNNAGKGLTNPNDADDATNIKNMKKAVDQLPMVNQYRQTENQTQGTALGEFTVSPSLMAIAQVQLNYANRNNYHAKSYQVAENLAWDLENPYTSWYDAEKAKYLSGRRDGTQQYRNIVTATNTTTGLAYSTTKANGHRFGYSQTFCSPQNLYAAGGLNMGQFQSLFDTYYKKVRGDSYRPSGFQTKPANLSGSALSSGKYVQMLRLYNPNSGEHFYTADPSERDGLVTLGWHDEGIGWIAPKESNTPVYRVYNPNAGDHHYTTNLDEKNALVALGWQDEGIGWYSAEKEGFAVFRQYNPNAKAGSHNYTPDVDEAIALVTMYHWKDEDVAWLASGY